MRYPFAGAGDGSREPDPPGGRARRMPLWLRAPLSGIQLHTRWVVLGAPHVGSPGGYESAAAGAPKGRPGQARGPCSHGAGNVDHCTLNFRARMGISGFSDKLTMDFHFSNAVFLVGTVARVQEIFVIVHFRARLGISWFSYKIPMLFSLFRGQGMFFCVFLCTFPCHRA